MPVKKQDKSSTMSSDSEREKSSDPNDDTSSENRTFLHSDDYNLDEDIERTEKHFKSESCRGVSSKGIKFHKDQFGAYRIDVAKTKNIHDFTIKSSKHSKVQNERNTPKNGSRCFSGKNTDCRNETSDGSGEVSDDESTNLINQDLEQKYPNMKIVIKTQEPLLSVQEFNWSKPETTDMVEQETLISEKTLFQDDVVARKISKSDSDIEMKDLSSAELKLNKDIVAEFKAKVDTNINSTDLNPPRVLVNPCHFRQKLRESIDFFYSAHDLLEYYDLNTPEMESGYFERSESDLSRDDNEASTSLQGQKTMPRKNSKQSAISSISENLRVELNKLKDVLENVENECENKICGNAIPKRELTLDCGSANLQNSNQNNFKTDILLNQSNQNQLGYWSTIFGQASQLEDSEVIPLDKRIELTQQAHRALELLEDYHSRLSEPQDRALRIAIERVIRIFKSRLFQALLARDFMEAYRCQTQCIQAVVKMLQQLKEENWCLPIMYTVCLDLRVLAQRCEEFGNSSKPGEILEKAADCLMSCFRVCAADNRSSDDDTKRLGMLNLVNQLFKVYFRINKLHLCKPLIRAIDSSAFKESFPLPEKITYKYFVGRKAMFDSDYKSADEFLSFALANCPRNFPRNKRLILIYLVPVKMLLGYMPKKHILDRFDVLQFHELAIALKEGNVRKFDEVIQRHEIFFIKCGIYLLVEKLKFIVYRNLFKKVYLIKQTHQLVLSDFRAALQFVGETDMSIDETHCIVANLIFEGKIKGYISHSHNKLVVSKQNPFPTLNTVS